MIDIQNHQLTLQTDIHILSGHTVQVGGQIQLDTCPLQTVAQDLADSKEISCKFVHVSSRTTASIMEPDMRNTQVAEQLPKVR